MRDNRTELDRFVDRELDPIILWHGNMRVAFPAGTSQAEIDKRIKKMDANVRAGRKPDTRLKMPKLTRLKTHTKGFIDDSGVIVPSNGRAWAGFGATTFTAPGRPLVVMPEANREAAQIATCERNLKKWAKDDPLNYGKWEQARAEGKIAAMSTEHIEKVLGNILRPGGRLTAQYAASVVYGLEELARRKCETVAS